MLRQDPNIIMVGEIRDLETAEIAVRAAMTATRAEHPAYEQRGQYDGRG